MGGGGENLREHKKLNSPIFKPDFLPCAHTHHYLVSHIKSQLIPADAIEEIVKMEGHKVPFFSHIHRTAYCI